MSIVAEKFEDTLATRYSLLSRLQDWGDQDSWKDFFDTYWRLIYSIAIKSGLTESEAQDVVQETVISVCKDIHKFQRDRGLGSFKGWLRNITRWRIADQFRKRALPGMESLNSDSPLFEEMVSVDSNLESLWNEEWQANLFQAALERVKRKVKEEQYQAFDLYVLRGWPVKKVSETLGLSLANIYLIKHRVASILKAEIRSLEQKPL